jgi:hypothetical protein
MKHKIHVDDKATLRPPGSQPKESEVELRPVSRIERAPTADLVAVDFEQSVACT